jgi:hypothetical protein
MGLQGLPVSSAAMADWSRMCDELMDCNLEIATEAELALDSGIRRKRPDGWAVHWGLRRVRILEFTRCNDRSDWRETTEEYITTRYQPLCDKMAAGLPPAWSVETVCFTLGIRGSYAESRWAASLAALGVPPARVAGLMATLVPRCLTELNELYTTCSTALRHRLDSQ